MAVSKINSHTRLGEKRNRIVRLELTEAKYKSVKMTYYGEGFYTQIAMGVNDFESRARLAGLFEQAAHWLRKENE